MTRRPLSVVIITRDEEASIARCLDSVRWADEVIVVDSGSADRTMEIAGQHGCRVIQTAWRGFGLTKRYAVEQASHDWVFSVDADEEATGQLAQAIIVLLEQGPAAVAYRVQRRSFYLGSPIRFSGWQHDRPVRLFDRRRGTFNDRALHESVVMDGPVERIRSGLLLHYPYPTVSSHLAKMERYAALGARNLFQEGRRASIPEALGRGAAKFLKMYFLRGGFLDGKAGLILAENSAFGVYLKYLTLWELSRRPRST